MNLTESQLFTIEALNRIDGFVWPDGATNARIDSIKDDNIIHLFSDSNWVKSVSYQPTKQKKPDWRNSLITREQFDSVDGWVRLSTGLANPSVMIEGKTVDGVDYCRYVRNEVEVRQPEPQKLTLLEILVRELPKRGGWPKDANIAVQYYDEAYPLNPKILFGDGDSIDNFGMVSAVDIETMYLAIDRKDKVVTRNEYLREALRASKGCGVVVEGAEKIESIEELYEKYQTAASGLIDAQMQVDYLKKQSEEALAEIKKWHQERGFSVSVIGSDAPEHANGGELNITDWRDLRAGDWIECIKSNGGAVRAGDAGVIVRINGDTLFADFDRQKNYLFTDSHFPSQFKFTRRP